MLQVLFALESGDPEGGMLWLLWPYFMLILSLLSCRTHQLTYDPQQTLYSSLLPSGTLYSRYRLCWCLESVSWCMSTKHSIVYCIFAEDPACIPSWTTAHGASPVNCTRCFPSPPFNCYSFLLPQHRSFHGFCFDEVLPLLSSFVCFRKPPDTLRTYLPSSALRVPLRPLLASLAFTRFLSSLVRYRSFLCQSSGGVFSFFVVFLLCVFCFLSLVCCVE